MNRALFAAVTLTLTLSSQPLQAALYWDGTSTGADADGGAGTWLTGTNTDWDSAPNGGTDVVWTEGSDAVFGGAAGTVAVSGTVGAGSIAFDTTGYSLTGGTITLTGTHAINTGSGNASITSVIGGAAGLNKGGTGMLTLSGTNTYTGLTTVSAGTLKTGSAAALGAVAAGSETTVSAGATLDVNGQNLGAEVVTIAGAGVGGAGAVVNTTNAVAAQNALRFLTLAAPASVGGTARWDLRGTNTLTMGGFALTKTGLNDFHLVGTTVATPGSIDVAQGSLWVETTTALGGSATNALTVRTGATLTQYANNIGHLWTANFETGSTWYATNTVSQWAGPVTIAGATTLNSDGNGMTNAGIISGLGSITKTGAGSWTLSAVNTFAGGTTVNAGNLILNAVTAGAGTIRGPVTVNPGATLTLNMPNAVGYTAGTQINPLNITGGTVNNLGVGDNGWGTIFNLTGGVLQSNSGVNVLTAPQYYTLGNNCKVNVLAAAVPSVISGRLNLRDANTNNAAAFDVADGAAGNDLLVNAAISQAAAGYGIVKTNLGQMTLAGPTAYTGNTTINGGTLVLGATGSLPTSPVIVSTGATFRNDAGGKTLTSISAANGSTLAFPAQTGATTTLTGNLVLADGASINVSPLIGSATTTGTYDLITAAAITGTGTPVLSLSGPFGPTRATGSVAVNGNKLQLTLTGLGADLVWNNASAGGVATGTWDNALPNFNTGSGNDAFQAFDAVTFNDSVVGAAKTINLSGVLAPSRITVNNAAGDYTFASTGALAGAGSLVKTGSSSLTISSTTDYTLSGDVTAGGGVLDFSGKLISIGKATLSGGSFNNASVAAAGYDFQSGSATATFGGSGAWAKTTAGTVTLLGNNTLSGAGTVSAGSLVVGNATTPNTNGALGSGAVAIASGASVSVYRSNFLAMTNAFSGAGALNFTGTNNGTTVGALSEVQLTGNNSTFSGSITATGIRVRTADANSMGPGLATAGLNGQYYLASAGTLPTAFSISGNGWGETAGQLGAIRFGGGTVTGPVTLTGNARIGAHASSGNLSGPIGETGGPRNLELGGSGSLSTLTLSGASTYTGTTTLTLANVNLTGSLAGSAVTVAAGSTIRGNGSIGNGGSLSFATGATNLGVDVATSPLTVNGNVSLGGTTTVALTGSASGIVPVLNYTGTLTGTTANLALLNSANYRQAIFAISPTQITVNVGGKALRWNGTSGGQWTIGGTNLRWSTPPGTGETDAFFNGDSVIFDETGTNTTIALTGAVQPTSIIVDSTTKNYTFTETAANFIAGNGSLTKNGSSTLTLGAGQNTFTGGTIVNGGTLVAGGPNSALGSLGAGNVTVNNGGTISVTGDNGLVGFFTATPKILRINSGGTVTTGGASNHLNLLVLDGGSLTATTPNATYTNWNLDYGVSTPGTGAVSTISGGNISLSQAGGAKFTVGAGDTLNVSSVVAHVTGAGDLGLIKLGAGTLNLSAENTYTSATTVSAGALMVNNTTGSGTGTAAVTVAAGATLGGTGIITGPVTSAGIIAPGGASAGTLSTGAATLTGSYVCQINGANADKLVVNGDLNVAGATLAVSNLGGAGQPLYTIASYTGALTGTFNVTSIPGGYQVNYNAIDKRIELIQVDTAFDTWANGFPLLEDKSADGDPDGDGMKNLLEYVLGGDPTVSDSAIAPKQTFSEDGNNLVFKYKRNDASETDTTQTVQWSGDLANWNSISIPADDFGVVTVDENDANPDDVTVTIPRLAGKMFVRLKAVR